MEVVIDCYFDRLFSELNRSSLASRYRRQQLVKYFSDVINSCAKGELFSVSYQEILLAENLEKSDVCRRIVEAALRYHNISLSENNSICLLSQFHSALFIAAKLCFDWNLEYNDVVSRVLNDIFYCERNFERIFAGAILGTKVTYFLSGWKSDFEDREENLRALVYFMDHAVRGKLEYRCPITERKKRFIDVCMESYGRSTALELAVENGKFDVLYFLLHYGASHKTDDFSPQPIENLLSKLNEIKTENSEMKKEYPQPLVACLKLFLRTINVVYVQTPSHVAAHCGVTRVFLHEQYPELSDLVPSERSGICPPELKHICRVRIRGILNENWALPHGLEQLNIPDNLKNYLGLKID